MLVLVHVSFGPTAFLCRAALTASEPAPAINGLRSMAPCFCPARGFLDFASEGLHSKSALEH
eukprot:scaffold876_cov243-Pinguiococcus_pyrenoidosus.AAC.53